jgi:DNA-binding PadR family transcriptional regulator
MKKTRFTEQQKGVCHFCDSFNARKKQMYGYERIQTILSKKRKGFWRQSAIYTALRKMEKAGLIKGR